MHKTCTWDGNTTRCKLVLPRMTEVAVKLKQLYEQSVYSKIRISLGVTKIIIVDRRFYQRVSPWQMIHFSHSPDYCMANSEYNIAGIEGRECTLKNKLSSQHCDNLCCDRGYENVTVTEKEPCNCKFFWCCRVECDACDTTRIIQRCKVEPKTSSTSHIDNYAMITNSTMDITDYIHT